MRKYMNIINRLLFGAVALAALSCTGNFEAYNRNPDQPSTIDRDVWDYIKSMQYNVIPTVKNQYQIVENVSGGAYGRYFAYAKSTDAGWNTGMFAFYRIANDWANPPYEVPMTNIYSNWRAIKAELEEPEDDYRMALAQIIRVAAMQRVTDEMMEANRRHIKAGNPSQLPGDKWGIAKITNIVHVPNMKTDANNQHGVFVSTDLPEENWPWPTSSWEWRDKFAQRLREYTEGLFWFAQNDPELPAHFRKAAKEWGLSKDEYTDNGHFPRQVYVREGRRFEGMYFFTANDAVPVTIGSRPPIHESSITASHYALDSHAVRKRETGRIHLDGFISYPSAVYTVPYGVMVPKEVDNLLLPVPVSGSHIGFSTLRMEPCWMAMGQAAGIASALSIDEKVKVQNIDLSALQDNLVNQKATLMYFKDVDYTDPHFRMVQYLGLRGYLPEWNARLQEPIDAATLTAWKRLSGLDLTGFEAGKTTRLTVLENIYREIK